LLQTRYILLFCSLFAFATATATATEPQQEQGVAMVVHNTNNFYVAEGSMAVKGLAVVATETENNNVTKILNAIIDIQDTENQELKNN